MHLASAHLGASTTEAQEGVAVEIDDAVISALKVSFEIDANCSTLHSTSFTQDELVLLLELLTLSLVPSRSACTVALNGGIAATRFSSTGCEVAYAVNCVLEISLYCCGKRCWPLRYAHKLCICRVSFQQQQ